jgi:hypothetical protein
MEAMANTIPNAATGSKATPLHRAFIREMLMAQEVEGYVANCRTIGEFCTLGLLLRGVWVGYVCCAFWVFLQEQSW